MTPDATLRKASFAVSASLVLATLIAGVAASQTANRPSPVTTPIVYSVPGMDSAVARKDIAYKTVGETQLKLDVYLPPPSVTKDNAPAVLLVSGNALPRGWLSFESTARVLAANGMAGIVFDKRYSRGSYYDTESDLADLFAFLRQEGPALGINPDRTCVVVYSGGGPLLSVALRRMQPAARCAVAFYAFLNSDEWGAPAGERRAKAMEDFSPAVQVRVRGNATPPLLVIKAGLDGAGLNATIDNFMNVARESGAPVQFMEHAQGRHGFDILDNNDRSREIIRATIEFLKAHLR